MLSSGFNTNLDQSVRSSIAIAYGGDEEVAIAALLHDAVEDAGGLKRLREIRKKFGKRVARIVDGCTDAYSEPKPPWLERKQKYIARVAGEPEDTRLVSAADKLSNARDVLARDSMFWRARELAKLALNRGQDIEAAALRMVGVIDFPVPPHSNMRRPSARP